MLQSLDPLGVFSDGPLNEKAARVVMMVLYANLYGFALTIVLTMGRALINERVPWEMQGRVFAAQSVLTNLCAIVPVVLAGVLADTIGVAAGADLRRHRGDPGSDLVASAQQPGALAGAFNVGVWEPATALTLDSADS